jgi:hypothetical protein
MNNPGEITIIQALEKPLSSDINQIASDILRYFRFWMERIYGQSLLSAIGPQLPVQAVNPVSGAINSGFLVRASDPPDGNVIITKGMALHYTGYSKAAVDSVLGVNDTSPYKVLMMPEDEVVQLAQPFPGAGQSRYDIIELRDDLVTEEPSTRLIYDEGSRTFKAGLVNKLVSINLNGKQGQVLSPAENGSPIGYKVGVAAATGAQVEPTPSSGYRTLARILVGEGTTTIDSDRIVDRRNIAAPNGYQVLSFTVTKLATGKPVLSSLNVPPGYIVLASSLGAAGFTVFVIGGIIVDVHAFPQVATAGGVGNLAIYVARSGAFLVQEADSAKQTELLDAANMSTTYKIAVGQKYAQFDVAGFRQVNAVTDQTMPNPMVVHVMVVVKH